MYKLFFLFCLPLVLATSCVNIKDVQCTGAKGFKINKVNTEGIDAEIYLTIKNPNHFGFSIYKSEFDVQYAGIKLGKAKLAKKVSIGANKEEAYPFSLVGDFKGTKLSDVLKVLESFTRKSMLEIKGDLKVGKLFVKKSFPIDVKQNVSAETRD